MRVIETEMGTFEIPEPPKIKMKNGKELSLPVFCPILVPKELIVANNYNPNHVSNQNMELLKESVIANGFCFAIVTVWDEDLGKFVIVDGFHRNQILDTWLGCDEIPIIVLEHDISKRMQATVQFNRARGVHQVELMGDLVKALVDQGVDDLEIAKKLGMEIEEVFRLKQITGIAELFKHQTYSKSWEMVEVDEIG